MAGGRKVVITIAALVAVGILSVNALYWRDNVAWWRFHSMFESIGRNEPLVQP